MFTERRANRVGKCDWGTLKLFWAALEADKNPASQATNISIKLALLTGQRPGDITRAHIRDIDYSRMEWRPAPERNKMRSDKYLVPLTDCTAGLFKKAAELAGGGEWLFPGKGGEALNPKVPARRWNRLRRELIGAGEWLSSDTVAIYDAGRRLMRTVCERDLEISEVLCELMLNHHSGGMSRLYMKGEMTSQLREAHAKYQAYFLMRALGDPSQGEQIGVTEEARAANVTPAGDNVVTFKAAAE